MQCTLASFKKIHLYRIPFSTSIKAMKILPFKSSFLIALIAVTSMYGAAIQTNNQVLVKIGTKAITVLDIKREMDRQIYLQNPQMFDDATAICGFYYKNWKNTLQKITQDEVFLLVADHLKYVIPAPDITQKVAQLFGDNEFETYKFLSITIEQAREMAKRDLYSAHLAWFSIWSKALSEATPKTILGAYTNHVKDLAKKDTWTYQALYLSSRDEKLLENTTSSISTLLKEGKYENLALILDQVKNSDEKVQIGLSKDITLKTNEISPNLLAVLENLEEGMTSEVVSGSRNGIFTGKILQLKKHTKENIPTLATVSEGLKSTIVNTIAEQITKERFTALYKQYDVQGLFGNELFDSKLEPFSLQDE